MDPAAPPMGGSAVSTHYGYEHRLYRRWIGWRDDQPERYPLEVIVTGQRQSALPRPSLSRWSDTPCRVIPPPDEPTPGQPLVLRWFPSADAEGSSAGSDDGEEEQP